MKYEGWKIGSRIQKIRKEKNLTIEKLSEEVGMSSSHISQIEQGGRKMSVDLLFRLMAVLQVDANTLLAVPKFNGVNVSIDEQLLGLPEAQQQYFKNTFLQMIREFPM